MIQCLPREEKGMAALTPVRFRVYNFRNIDDSDWIELAQVIALVGRNESGKTALLKALHKFNPATPQPYVARREFPRDRFTRDFKNGKDWRTCAVEFEIDEDLRQRLPKAPAGQDPKKVTYTRNYDGSLHCSLDPAPVEARVTYELVSAAIGKFRLAAMQLAPPAPGEEAADQEATYQSIRSDLLKWTSDWADKFRGADSLRSQQGQQLLQVLRDESNSKGRPEVVSILPAFQSELAAIAGQATAQSIGEQIEIELRKRLPVFIYFDNYGILDSAVYLPRFIEDLARDPTNPRVRTAP